MNKLNSKGAECNKNIWNDPTIRSKMVDMSTSYNEKKTIYKSNMKEIENTILQYILFRLRLEKQRQEFGNKYVFGFDDVERIILSLIK